MKYMFKPILQTPSHIGSDQPDGTRLVDSTRGHVSYGPSCRLGAGRYFGGFRLQAIAAPDDADVVSIDIGKNKGATTVVERWLKGRELLRGRPGLQGVFFELNGTIEDIEVRLFASGVGSFKVQSMVLFRTDLEIR